MSTQSTDPRIIKTSSCGKYVLVQAKDVSPAAWRTGCHTHPDFRWSDSEVRPQSDIEIAYIGKNPNTYCWIRSTDLQPNSNKYTVKIFAFTSVYSVVQMRDIKQYETSLARSWSKVSLQSSINRMVNIRTSELICRSISESDFDCYCVVRTKDLTDLGLNLELINPIQQSPPVIDDAILAARISANIGETRAQNLRKENSESAKLSSEAWSRMLRNRIQKTKNKDKFQVLIQPMFDPWD